MVHRARFLKSGTGCGDWGREEGGREVKGSRRDTCTSQFRTINVFLQCIANILVKREQTKIKVLGIKDKDVVRVGGRWKGS